MLFLSLLFALAIKSLNSHFTLTALKISSALYGIKCEGTQYRVSSYADDLLLYLTDPEESIPGILSILEKFCSSQAKKVQKSEYFLVHVSAQQIPQVNIETKFRFKYLRVNITCFQMLAFPAVSNEA